MCCSKLQTIQKHFHVPGNFVVVPAWCLNCAMGPLLEQMVAAYSTWFLQISPLCNIYHNKELPFIADKSSILSSCNVGKRYQAFSPAKSNLSTMKNDQ